MECQRRLVHYQSRVKEGLANISQRDGGKTVAGWLHERMKWKLDGCGKGCIDAEFGRAK